MVEVAEDMIVVIVVDFIGSGLDLVVAILLVVVVVMLWCSR